MRRSKVVLVLTAAAVSRVAGAQALTQEATAIGPGSRVRLTLSVEEAQRTGRELVKGIVVTGDPERFIVARQGGAGADTVPTFTIDRLEVYRGQRSRRTMVIAGTAAGGSVSLLWAGLAKLSNQQRCRHVKDCKPLYNNTFYAVPVVVGALFGSTFSAARWMTVARPTLSLESGAKHGVVILSTIGFR